MQIPESEDGNVEDELARLVPLADMPAVIDELDAAQGPGGRILNCREALERLDGDLELFRDLIGFFFMDGPRLSGAIRDGATQRNGEALRKAAHRLKGLIANFASHPAVAAAFELEQIGRDNRWPAAKAALETFEARYAELTATLEKFRLPEAD